MSGRRGSRSAGGARARATKAPKPRGRRAPRPIDWASLLEAARRARQHAYAPYSGFAVGAAVLARDGRVFAGCNVENASYGLCLCAERSAVAAATTAGTRDLVAVAIVAPGPTPVTPCGMCRQVLAEVNDSMAVRCCTPDGTTLETDVSALLPHAFGRETLERSEE